MIISYFLRNKQFHIAAPDYTYIYEVSKTQDLADNIVVFLQDALEKSSDAPIDTLIFQAGPMSFTSHRIVNSIAKGFCIVDKKIKFIAVSSFFTYFLITSQKTQKGTICIPTMRGDYFTQKYNNFNFDEVKIQNLTGCEEPIYIEQDLIFNNKNLAEIQIMTLNIKINNINRFITHKILNVNYGYTPEYNY
jgi:tRNA A37 threonylcarbamoyladenosine modification protein TsaB